MPPILKNIGIMSTGHAGAGLMSIFALVVTARATGVEAFGVLAMIQTFVRLVDTLVNFQSWQALVKFATQAREDGDREGYQRVVRSCARLDRWTAVIATALAIALTLAAWRVFELSISTLVYTLMYCSVILTNLTGAPIGVLRVAGRFRLMALLNSGAMAFKLVAVVIGWWAEWSFGYFVIAWIVTDITMQLAYLIASERELRAAGDGSLFGARLGSVRKHHPGFIRFVVMTNLTSSVKLAGQQLTILATGGILSEAAAGLLRVAQTVNRVIGMFADPVDQVVYPELSKLWARGRVVAFIKIIVALGLLSLVIGSALTGAFTIWGERIISLFFGVEFIDAFAVTVLLMIGTTVMMLGVGLRGALLAKGKADTLFWVHVVCYGLCLPVLPWLLWTYGLIGVGFYSIAFHVLRIVLMIALVVMSGWPTRSEQNTGTFATNTA